MSCHKCGYFEGHDEDCPTVVALDHGISPGRMRADLDYMAGFFDIRITGLANRLDAALRRIEQLERELANVAIAVFPNRASEIIRRSSAPSQDVYDRIAGRPSAPIDKEDV